MNGKAFIVLNARSFVEILVGLWLLKTLKKVVSLTYSDDPNFLEAEENQTTLRKTKVFGP